MTEASEQFHPPDDDGQVVDQVHLDQAAGPAGLDGEPAPDAPATGDATVSAGEELSQRGGE